MTPGELFQSGKLQEAIEASFGIVRKEPTDAGARYLLSEFLCVAGELERADRQLDTLAKQSTEATPRVSLIRQLIRAETARRQYYSDGRLPEFLVDVSPSLRLYLDALVALRGGEEEEAAESLSQADAQRPRQSGICDGVAFNDLRDLDDLTASCLELLTSTGKFYLVPFELISSLEFLPPRRPIDWLWRQVNMKVENGPDGDVYLPAIYPKTYEIESGDDLRLGLSTDWIGDSLPVRGVGERMLLVGDRDIPFHHLNHIQFQNVTGANVTKDL